MTDKINPQATDVQPVKRLALKRENVRNLGVRSAIRAGYSGGPRVSGGSSGI